MCILKCAVTVVVGVISIIVVIEDAFGREEGKGYERLLGQIQQQPDTEGTHAINLDTSA